MKILKFLIFNELSAIIYTSDSKYMCALNYEKLCIQFAYSGTSLIFSFDNFRLSLK